MKDYYIVNSKALRFVDSPDFNLSIFQFSIQICNLIMKELFVIALIGTLLVSAQTADYVTIKIQCKAQDSCDSNFEYVYSKGTNVSQTLCAETACEPHSFEVEAIQCKKSYNGNTCSSEFCINGYLQCANQNTACASQFNQTTECKECSTADKCGNDDTSVKGGCSWSAGTQGGCFNSDGCVLTKETKQIVNCQKDTFGGACKCCTGYHFEDLQSSGICVTTQMMPWYSDEFKKVFEAEAEDENFIPRELSQLLLVAIVGLFLSFNTL